MECLFAGFSLPEIDYVVVNGSLLYYVQYLKWKYRLIKIQSVFSFYNKNNAKSITFSECCVIKYITDVQKEDIIKEEFYSEKSICVIYDSIFTLQLC